MIKISQANQQPKQCSRCKKELRPDEANQFHINILHHQPQMPETFKMLMCNNCYRQLRMQFDKWTNG